MKHVCRRSMFLTVLPFALRAACLAEEATVTNGIASRVTMEQTTSQRSFREPQW